LLLLVLVVWLFALHFSLTLPTTHIYSVSAHVVKFFPCGRPRKTSPTSTNGRRAAAKKTIIVHSHRPPICVVGCAYNFAPKQNSSNSHSPNHPFPSPQISKSRSFPYQNDADCQPFSSFDWLPLLLLLSFKNSSWGCRHKSGIVKIYINLNSLSYQKGKIK
jgi:hypothetical protein